MGGDTCRYPWGNGLWDANSCYPPGTQWICFSSPKYLMLQQLFRQFPSKQWGTTGTTDILIHQHSMPHFGSELCYRMRALPGALSGDIRFQRLLRRRCCEPQELLWYHAQLFFRCRGNFLNFQQWCTFRKC